MSEDNAETPRFDPGQVLDNEGLYGALVDGSLGCVPVLAGDGLTQMANAGDGGKKYDPEVVEEFGRNGSDAVEFPSRHYNQRFTDWGDSETITTLLSRFDIDPAENTMVVIGGFTGEYANALKEAGVEVIFTDSSEEWTSRAETQFDEVHTAAGEAIDRSVLMRCTAVTTFECYHPLNDSDFDRQTMLRYLTVPDGLLFAESKATADEISEESDKKVQTLMTSWSAWSDVYDTTVRYRETDGLRIYQHYLPSDADRLPVLIDGWVSLLLVFVARKLGMLESDGLFDVEWDLVEAVAAVMDADPSTVADSIDRLVELNKQLTSEEFQRGPYFHANGVTALKAWE